MNVLVTGAAGFIGSVCAELLIDHGVQVVALDDLSEGNRASVPPQASFHLGDFGVAGALDELFKIHRIDAVMHFAAEALVGKSMKEPSAFYLTNVAKGIVLLDAMVRHGIKNLVFASTCAVYGETSVVPIPEGHFKSPVNPYGASKLAFEQVLADYRKYAGLKFVSLRYFNVAGASEERGEDRRTETHLIPCTLQAIQSHAAHTDVYGSDYDTPDGTCVRDYVHVLDVARAHICALENMNSIAGEAFNVGTGIGHSIREVIDVVSQVTGQKILEKALPRRLGDPAILIADGMKIRSVLGWQPRHSSLREIVSSAWRWKQRHPYGYGISLPACQ